VEAGRYAGFAEKKLVSASISQGGPAGDGEVGGQRSLRDTEALFDLFMRHTPALAFIRDSEGRIVYVNPAYEQFFGASLGELRGKPLTAVVPDDNARELAALYTRVLQQGQPLETTVTFPSPEGVTHEWDFHLFPITDSDGVRFLGGLALDLSHQRSLEAQLRQSHKMEAVGKLAGGVAHDFNNILGVINGYISLVLEDHEVPPTAARFLEEALKAGERAAGLTRQLLTFSRQQVLHTDRMDLNDVLAELGGMLGRLIGEDLDLVVRPAPEPCPILADRGQIEQILMNLVVNARDAMPNGGQITVEAQTTRLDETYVRQHFDLKPGAYVLLAVTDTGCGMDPETRERVFDPFFTTKSAGSGTGLGLSTVHGIVRQSGGDIHVYSEPGIGTSFKIYFPLAAGADASEAEAAWVPVRGVETLLLVEDDPVLRNLVRIMLADAGYQVMVSLSSEHAIQLGRSYEGTIDLLLTDVVMPGAGGREVAEAVAAARPGIKTLYMSGYTDDAVVRHGVLTGECNFIQKPFTPAALTRKLRQALDGPTDGFSG
jgi:two-component system cell cycle sensor histidine kinase/response regulator CckA